MNNGQIVKVSQSKITYLNLNERQIDIKKYVVALYQVYTITQEIYWYNQLLIQKWKKKSKASSLKMCFLG